VKPSTVVSHLSALQEDPRQWCSIGLQLQKEVPILIARFPNDLGEINILECAVGKGEHAAMLRHYGFHVTTVDVDLENNPEVIIDIENKFLTHYFKDSSFHAITSHHTLEHIPFNASIRVISEFYAILKPRGVLFISLPSRCRPFAGSLRFARWKHTFNTRQLKTFTPDGWHKWEVDQNHHPKKIKQILLQTGFKTVEIHTSHLNPFEYQFVAYKGED
jgi:SAM-dependent methyltransferase